MRPSWVLASLLLAVVAFPAAAASARSCIACPRPIPEYGSWREGTVLGRTVLMHEDDPKLPNCRYCSAFLSPYSPWGRPVPYADGRVVCGACDRSAVKTQAAAQARLDRVRGTIEGWGMKFGWGRIPVRLVGQSELTRIVAKDHPGLRPDGVCQPTLLYAPGSSTYAVKDLKISMLTGVPPVYFEKTAAHELMHAWMALNGCPREQAPAFREGACNLIAFYYLQTMNSPKATELRKLMMKEPDPTYGDGLRRHVRYAQAYRVRGMLALLKAETDFPAGF